MSVQSDPDDSRQSGAGTTRPPDDTRSAARGPAYAVTGVLLLAPFVALLWVSSYAKVDPRLFGFPFFYWYQFLWVFITPVLTYVAFLLVHRVERTRPLLTDRSERHPGGRDARVQR